MSIPEMLRFTEFRCASGESEQIWNGAFQFKPKRHARYYMNDFGRRCQAKIHL